MARRLLDNLRRQPLLALTALVVFAAIIYTLAPFLFGGRSYLGTDTLVRRDPWRIEATAPPEPIDRLPVGDTFDSYAPQRELLVDGYRNGDVRWWNPYMAGGTTLAATPSTAAFSASTAAAVVVPGWYANGLLKFLEYAAAIGFTYLFLRKAGIRREAAVLGGLIFAFSGFQTVWSNWPHTRVAALIPALFWLVERWVQHRRRADVIGLAAVVAAMLLEGFPAVAGYGMYAAGLYAVVRVAAEDGVERRSVATASVVLGAMVLGITLVAWQILPFLQHLDYASLDRASKAAGHSPTREVAMLAVSDVFGTPAEGTYFNTTGYITAQGFVGAATCVLVASAAARRTPVGLARGLKSFLMAAVGVSLVLIYWGGPLLDVVNDLPVFNINSITRLRSILGFLMACAAAVGLHAMLEPRSDTMAPWRRWLAILVAVGLSLAAVRGAQNVLTFARDFGRESLTRQELQGAAILVLIVLLAIGVAALARRSRPYAFVVVGAVIVFEMMSFVLPIRSNSNAYWFFPSTESHQAVQSRIGNERLAAEGEVFFTGTTNAYEIRTVTGHLFHQPTWKEMLLALDQTAFDRSRTFSFLDYSEDLVKSPLLDRMAANLFAASPGHDVIGAHQPVVGDGVITAPVDEVISAELDGGPLRGLTIDVIESRVGAAHGDHLLAELRTSDGTVVGRGVRLLPVPLGPIDIPIAGEDIALGTPLTASLEVVGRTGALELRADGDGQLAVAAVAAQSDGLELVHSNGSVLYRRTTAMPRVRWAGSAQVVTDADERLRLLSEGLDPDVVLVNAPAEMTSGAAATVAVRSDTGDEMTVDVSAEGSGYLVVADALQWGWSATVDGRPADLVAADHAFVAVHVPPGNHVVELRYSHPGRSTGLIVTVGALLIVALIAIGPRRLRAATSWRPIERMSGRSTEAP